MINLVQHGVGVTNWEEIMKSYEPYKMTGG